MEDNKGVPKESLYASLALALPSLKEKGLADELVVRPVLPPSTRQSRASPTRTSEASQTERAEVIGPWLRRKWPKPRWTRLQGASGGNTACRLRDPSARRYELAHVIGIDEHPKLQKEAIVASAASGDADMEAPVEETFPILTTRAGTLLHAALERFTVTHWSNAHCRALAERRANG